MEWINWTNFTLDQWDAFTLDDWGSFLLDPAPAWRVSSAAAFVPGSVTGTAYITGLMAGGVSQ